MDAKEHAGEHRRRARGGGSVIRRAPDRQCLLQRRLGPGRLAGRLRRLPEPLQDPGPLGLVVGHDEGLVEERDGLRVGAEGGRALGGRAEGDPGLRREGVGSGTSGAFAWAAR